MKTLQLIYIFTVLLEQNKHGSNFGKTRIGIGGMSFKSVHASGDEIDRSVLVAQLENCFEKNIKSG